MVPALRKSVMEQRWQDLYLGSSIYDLEPDKPGRGLITEPRLCVLRASCLLINTDCGLPAEAGLFLPPSTASLGIKIPRISSSRLLLLVPGARTWKDGQNGAAWRGDQKTAPTKRNIRGSVKNKTEYRKNQSPNGQGFRSFGSRTSWISEGL